MSFGNNSADGGWGKQNVDRYRAEADRDRAMRLAGYKSPLRRLAERLLSRRRKSDSAER